MIQLETACSEAMFFQLSLLIFMLAIPAAIYGSAQGPGPESAPPSAFRVFLGTWLGVPQRVFFECFLELLKPQKCQKALTKHSVGHSEPGAQKHSKSTRRGTFRPGPLSTPVNGSGDCNFMHSRGEATSSDPFCNLSTRNACISSQPPSPI